MKSLYKTKSSKWWFFPTHKLEEILRNDGMTDNGTAYDWALPEIEQELWKRQRKNADKIALQAVRAEATRERGEFYDGKTSDEPPPLWMIPKEDDDSSEIPW